MEDNELLPLDNLITEAEAPLPDIITPDDTESGAEQIVHVTPSIIIAEGGESGEGVTKNYTVDKTYTVDEGFERPDGGRENVLSTTSVCGSEDEGEDSDSDDGSGDSKSSSSSSFPSESSGIFYKAEYTPPPVQAQPTNNLLTVENRDTFWRNFFSRNSGVSSVEGRDLQVQRSRSGCDGLAGQQSNICQSKSDAKIGYNDPVTCSDLTDVRNISCLPHTERVNERSSLQTQQKNIEGQSEDSLVIPRTLKSPLRNEIFDQPWTEVGGDSPEVVSSQDNLTTTISQEMQDLLTSIQSLGQTEEANKSKQPSPPKLRDSSPSLAEKNVDFQSLMKEVENQIRFSVTAELLERMTNCPAIENYFLPGAEDKKEESVVEDTYLGSPPIPDLLRTSVKPPPVIDRLSQTHFFSGDQERKASLPAETSPSPSERRRFTSLPRPSDMTGANNYQLTGLVPDMRARVSSTADQDSYSVCSDLSKVRSDIDSLCDIINKKADTREAPPVRLGNDQLELELRETQHVMKDIEHTVDNFRRHLSLPNGKVKIIMNFDLKGAGLFSSLDRWPPT